MEHLSPLIWCVIIAGFGFDFVNGFHDAANSIATIVATRVLKPKWAVAWAAFFNFIAVFVFGTAVAKMVGSGLIAADSVTPTVVLCGLCGAVVWGLITWWFGLPTSSSHALLGGYAGAAIANSVLHNGWSAACDPIIAAGWIKVLSFIVLAPVIGLVLGHSLMRVVAVVGQQMGISPHNKGYKILQLASSAFLSLMHGSNDAQKTAGIIASALLAAGVYQTFTIPVWVLGASYAVMGLGTLFGGWRIVQTMGFRLTHLEPQGGVCAESAAALAIMAATLTGMPVSTTHVTTGAILGVGSASQGQPVHWQVARQIAWAWVLTIPAALLIGAALLILIYGIQAQ